MFNDFRQNAKIIAKEQGLTYAQIAAKAGVEESTIKCFMCGANDSRRVAEKIADALEVKIEYCNGRYSITDNIGG